MRVIQRKGCEMKRNRTAQHDIAQHDIGGLVSRAAPLAVIAVVTLGQSAPVRADAIPGLFVTPITFSALVQENLLPGTGHVFDQSQVIDSGTLGAPTNVDLLHIYDPGVNGSKRSTQIKKAFASAQADVHGNGGVGATNLLFGSPDPNKPAAVNQLVGQAVWTQTFTNTGSTEQRLNALLHVPALEVGLIGVPPNRTGPSATETAKAVASFDTSIHRADGSLEKGRSFSFGLEMHERQLILSPNNFENFADVTPIVTGSSLGFDPFVTAKCTFAESPGSPTCSINALSFSFQLDTLQPGDILSYVYTLTAEGTTKGFEHGYLAFLGDPFDLTASGGSIDVAAAVPEPATWYLSLAGLGLVGLALRRRSDSKKHAAQAPAFTDH
jgi:hypothetical protein